ncbi:MAG: YHS domain-containing protein [Phycisphaerales bacterium]|nr:YHS domain-containing protein [Phycisphaerales bacterium]
MDRVDASSVADWIDRKLIEFVETYLRLEQADEYQRENFVTDPVCGMRINRNSASGRSDYAGATYFFCVEECRRKFDAAPEKFVFAGKA